MAQAVSQRWRNALTQSRELVARVEILDYAGNPFRTTDPDSVNTITVTDLSVSVDRTRTVRGNANCKIHVPRGDELIPRTESGLLTPISGATFRVRAGFRYTDGTEEMVSCGRYDIKDMSIEETAGGVEITLQGEDLTTRLNVADLQQPVSIAWGTQVLDACKFLIVTTMPSIAIEAWPNPRQSAWVVLDEKANRLTEINKMLDSIGFELFMDPNGEVLRLQPVPTTEDQAMWSYSPSQIASVTKLTNAMSRDRVYNGVIAKGESVNSNDPPVRAEAWDTDKTSPTYFIPGLVPDTKIGPRPFFMTSQWIRTVEQAQEAADAKLRELKGLMQRVSVTATMNPAVNVGDVIDVTRPELGVTGRYVVEKAAFKLSQPDTMELVCQERRV